MEKKHLGILLAAAVGTLFATSSFADDPNHNPKGTVKCMGGNSCKSHSECQTATHGCKGQNKCKGVGYIMTATKEDCTKIGGKVEEK